MTADSGSQTDRHIPVTYDDHGAPCWHSTLTPPDPSYGICSMVPDRIIPVIFVPGIMGSNLVSKQNKSIKWRLDANSDLAGAWLFASVEKRKQYLQPDAMEVDRDGKIATGTQQQESHLRDRGWGEVGYTSYGEFLVWLENVLNDYDTAASHQGVRDQLIGRLLGAAKGDEPLTQDEVAVSYCYRFPVWACGYNWLGDNKLSAKRLQRRIADAIDHYHKKNLKCEKVIIVTHSMGGLVARCCSEVLGQNVKMFGIVHGVMPAIGAAAVYRRAKSGTRNAASLWDDGLKAWGVGKATSMVLGDNAAAMTAVLSTSPGAMELLPTPEYGRGWLRIKVDGQDIQLPTGDDPYGEIYTVRDKWWGLVDDALMDPLNDATNPAKRQAKMNADWVAYSAMILKAVKPFQLVITDRYNPTTYTFYANGKDHLAYGNVTWQGSDAFGERWLSGGRASDPLDAKALDPSQIGTSRTVATPLTGKGWKTGVNQTYTVSDPDEPGDGTVPERSGVAPKAYSKAVLTVDVEHEGAFRDCMPARMFTVYSIVKTAQAVKQTSLAYPGLAGK